MDWEGIRTAILDRERQRLGLPSRMELEASRAKQAQEAAESASGLETAGVSRERMRAEMAAMPVEQEQRRRLVEAQIENYKEPNRAERTGSWSVTPDGKHRINNMTGEVVPVGVPGGVGRAPAAGGGEGREPRTGWQPQFDAATGVLKGYYHPATETFRAVGEGNLPPGTAGNIPSGEREKRAGLQSILSDIGRLRELASGPGGQDIGYYSGRIAETRSSGMIPGVGAPRAETMEMIHISDNISDMLLRARSGAQINEQEYARLRKITPNVRTSPEKFWVDLDRFEIELRNVLAARQGQPVSQTLDPGAPEAPGGAPGRPMVQRNRRTGEMRHSLDGGATWQPGPPPQ